MPDFRTAIRCLSFVLLCTCWAAAAPTFAADLSADEILQILRTRDEQFDNANLHFRHFSETPADARTIAILPPEEQAVLEERDWKVQRVFNDQLTVRGNETTMTIELDPLISELNPPTIGGWMPFTRNTNIGGAYKEYWMRGDDDKFLMLMPMEQKHDTFLRARRRIEFSLGFGFGKCISSIDSAEPTPDRYLLKGAITPYNLNPGSFEIEVDHDFVVRHARISSKGGNDVEVVINVQTEGSEKNGPIVFAEKGTYEEARFVRPGEETERKRYVIDEFDIEFLGIDWELTDTEYEELTRIEPPPGTRVKDYVAGISYTVGDSPGEKSHIFRHGLDFAPLPYGSEHENGRDFATQDKGRPADSAVHERPNTTIGQRGSHIRVRLAASIIAAAVALLIACSVISRRRRSQKGGGDAQSRTATFGNGT